MLCNIFRYLGVIATYGTHRESFVPSYGRDFFFYCHRVDRGEYIGPETLS